MSTDKGEKKRAEAAAQASLERREEMAAHQKAAGAPKYIATHTLTSKETLSHLALEYYGHATPPYWKLIYEANKEVIGDNPNKVRPGLEIKIPELPPELKDK
jgi:nucleoid-associated protein YgaU